MELCPMDQQPTTTTSQPLAEQTVPATPAKGKNKRVLLALWLMIGPTALIMTTLILYAIVNFISMQLYPNDHMTTEMFGAPTLGSMLINIFLFIVGAISVAAWLPGLITGIVLLATQKKS